MDDINIYEKFPLQGSVTLPTKSMQEIITSIATKVTHFIISSSEKAKKLPSDGLPDNTSAYSSLVSASDSIRNALKELVEVSNQTVASNYSTDETVAEEVDVASQSLLVTGEHLHLCCQVLASTNGEVAASDSSCNMDLVSNVSKCFQSLVVLLLCMDNAEVRHLVELSNHVLEQLYKLRLAKSLEGMFENFKLFGDAVQKFHSRSMLRCDDILSTSNQSRMSKALTTLKHSMPVLATALSLALKYPHNEEAVSSKSFAVKQVEKTIIEVVACIKARPNENERNDEVGGFASRVRSVEKALNAENRHQLVHLELETMVQSLVQHIMSISSFASRRVAKLSRRAENLVRECQKLLKLTSAVVKMSPPIGSQTHAENGGFDNSSEYGSVCRAVRGKLKNIRNCVRSIVVSLFGFAFTVTTEPLVNLTRAYDPATNRTLGPARENRLRASISTFRTHVDDILQVAKFIEVCCSVPSAYRDIGPCIDNFASVSNAIVRTCADENDDAESSPLTKLSARWQSAFDSLLRFCVLSMDLKLLASDVEAAITSDFEKCHEDVVNLDDSELSSHVISAAGKARLLAAIANTVVNASGDPVFRNGVLAHTKILNEAIAHSVASSNLLIEDTARLASQEAFLAAASRLKEKVATVCASLFSTRNHFDITSGERKGLRESPDPNKVNGMIREMKNLNQKLSDLGFEPKAPAVFDAEKEKSQSEIVDEIFGTSGPAVADITNGEIEGETRSQTGAMTDPFVDRLLEASIHSEYDHSAVERSLAEMRMFTRYLTECCENGEACLRTCNDAVEDAADRSFTEINDDENLAMVEAVRVWKDSLSESYNLIEGCFAQADHLDRDLLKRLCVTWSESRQALTACLNAALKVFMIPLRRYVALPDGGRNGNEHSLSVDELNDGLTMIERTKETLSILLSDVIMLFKREVNNHPGRDSNSSLITRLDVLLTRSRQAAVDIRHGLKDISKKLLQSTTEDNTHWLHILALYCAAKLCALFGHIDVIVQLALGIRKLNLSADLFCDGDPDVAYLAEYKTKVHTLSLSAVSKIDKALDNGNMESKALMKDICNQLFQSFYISKLKKIRNRVELTCGSIEDVIAFILKKRSSASLLTQHGHLVFHFLFLHQRFALDVSRTFLVTKALTAIALSGQTEAKPADTPLTKESILQFHKREEDYSPDFDPAATSQTKPPTYARRLADLTEQRKQREKDLFLLLSDVDADPVTKKD